MPELALIVPTLNERENIASFALAVDHALTGIDYEIVFVDDDSEDGTSELIRETAQHNRRVRVVQRVGRRGLSGAAAEGMLATSSPYVAVMDADLQHDERILPQMLALMRATDSDIVVGTRNAAGGSMGSLDTHRVLLSDYGRKLSRAVCKVDLSDPMSGFFMLRRSFLDEVVHSLSLIGFKILLDLVASSPRPPKISEVPYEFRPRSRGHSKLDAVTALEYALLLAHKITGGWIPVSYLKFGMVGALGVLLNALFLECLLAAHLPLDRAQQFGAGTVIVLNFLFNNMFTFRPVRLQNGARWAGLAIFFAICTVGLMANVRLSAFLQGAGLSTWLSSLSGILIGSVWNYGVSSVFVWRVNGLSRRRHRLACLQNL
jgi:dolichol-phosphate mannosyltransferase